MRMKYRERWKFIGNIWVLSLLQGKTNCTVDYETLLVPRTAEGDKNCHSCCFRRWQAVHSLRNIVASLPLERSRRSVFLQLIRAPLSAPGSGALLRPRTAENKAPLKLFQRLKLKYTTQLIQRHAPINYFARQIW